MTSIENGIVNTFDISEIAYELYKQDWIDSNVTQEDRLNTLRKYFKYRKECLENNDEVDSFDEWLWESGYGNGSLYVCYEEFCDEEYRDRDYIRYLLNDTELFLMYCEDIADEE